MSCILAVQSLKTFFLLVMVLVIFAAGIWLGARFSAKSRPTVHEDETATVVEQIQTLSDLVTVKYVVEKAEILESPPSSRLGQFIQGNNRVLLLAHGIVKAGIDLKRLAPGDVTTSGKKIFIRLPPPQITDAYLDENQTKVIDWQRGFLRDFDKDLEQAARENCIADIRRAARDNGILNDAKERAQLELALLLHQAGFEQVQFNGEKPLLLPQAGADVSHF